MGMLLMEHTAFHDTDRMTPAEIEISEEALRFARSNKKVNCQTPDRQSDLSVGGVASFRLHGRIARRRKTEASIALVNLFADTPILRIDPDELRNEFAAYKAQFVVFSNEGIDLGRKNN